MFYGKVFRALNKARVRYVVAGGTAEQFIDDKQRDRWKKEKGMIVFSFVSRQPPFQMIDMFVNEPIRFSDLYSKKKDMRIEGIKIPLIGIDHLLKLKKQAGRAKDLDDIIQLTEIKRIIKK